MTMCRLSQLNYPGLQVLVMLSELTRQASFGLLGLACASACAQSAPKKVAIPAHKSAIVLFNGSDLSRFDTFLRGRGLNSDPEHVFKVESGVIHVSGQEMGYIITKQPFHRFYLRAEFKWGEGTFGERAGKARDSGILYNIQGEQKVWPRSLEFQIMEGETGDFWLTDGAALTGSDGNRVTAPPGHARNMGHTDKGPEQNVVGFRNTSGELEKPHGEWNTLELVADDKNVRQYVNGQLANLGTDPVPAGGKILFQSEGAEIFFRNIELYPLK